LELTVTPTLLLDLDDTLLVNDINTFLPVYLQRLSGQLADLAEPQHLIASLLAATQHMVQNTRPDCTLKEVFDAAFYPALNLEAAPLQPRIAQFYAEVFPSLRELTRPNPGAVTLVETALGRGWQVAVTTNPLFPRTAILQRLAWAGLPLERYPFALVTSYEDFHFAKPDPAFYAEVLGRLGWPEGPIVIVGDSLENDIQAAAALGVRAFWLPTPSADLTESDAPQGRLDDVLPWIDAQDPETLLPDWNRPSALRAILTATPAVLHTLSADRSAAALARRPQPDSWAAVEILAHLRDVEIEVNLPRLQRVLTEVNPFIAGKDTDPWAEARRYDQQDPHLAWRDFTAARQQTLALLRDLTPTDWERTARHAIFGTTHLAELVQIIAGHDRLHLAQFIAALPPV
jgi:FMN phosphatase YigB (HAD superfamily)